MVAENLKIEIRPIPNRKNIRDFSENLEYFSSGHTIMAFVDPKTRKFSTGLSKEDINYLKENGFPFDLSDNYIDKTPHPFWESLLAKTELKPNPTFLYPGRNLIDFIKYKYLQVNNYIYKSEAEMLTGCKPEATHYIYNEEEEVAIKATKVERKNKVIGLISKLSTTKKKNIILVLLNENVENKNEEYLSVKFDDIISNNDLFKQLEEILSTDTDKITVKAEVKKAIQKNVLRRVKEGIFFFDTKIGFIEDDVVDYLLKPENQEIYINIKEKL